MKRDPVRPNFLENTGAYLWQTAAWLTETQALQEEPAALKRAAPPVLQNAFAVWPSKIPLDSIVQWSLKTHVAPRPLPSLLSARGTHVAIAVNTSAQSFVEIPISVARKLQSPTAVGALSELADYGCKTSVVDATISLLRHDLLEIIPRPSAVLWGIRREAFVRMTVEQHDVIVATNLLTGRFLHINLETATMIDSLTTPVPVTKPLSRPLRTLVEAGVLRLVGQP